MEKPLDNLNSQEKRILNINQQLKKLAQEKATASSERKLVIEREEQNLHTELEGLKAENDSEESPKEKAENEDAKTTENPQQEEIKENKIEITDENFDLRIIGCPVGYAVAKSVKNKNEDTAWSSYQFTYNGDGDRFYLSRSISDTMIYTYKKGNLVSAIGRRGSFFAMSIELPKGIYCTNIDELKGLFEQIFEKIVVEKYNLLHKFTNGGYGYNESIKNDEFENPLVKKVQEEVRNIMLNNLRGTFSEDFKEIDDEFRKEMQPGVLYSKPLEIQKGEAKEIPVVESEEKTQIENSDYEAKKAEIENYIKDKIVFTGTDGGFVTIDTSNIKKEGAGMDGDVRRTYSDDHYEIITDNDEQLKSLFRDLKYGGDVYSWHIVDNYINKGKKYLIVGMSNRAEPGLDDQRNGSLFASIEDTGELPSNIKIFIEKALVDKYEEVRAKRPNIYAQLPSEFINKFNTRYNQALEELKKEVSDNKEEINETDEQSAENNEEEWTEEDEKTLQNLLLTIENTKKKIEEIEKEISELDENQSDTNNQKTIEDQKDKKSETENEPSPVEKSKETVEKYEEITLDDFKWSYPRNYTDALGSIWINYNDDKCDYHHIEIEEFTTKEVPRTLAGKLIHNSAYKTIKLKEPYCEIHLSKQDPDQPSQQPEVIKVNNKEEAIIKVNELLKNYSIKRASEVDISGNQWVSPLIPYHAQEKITNNIKYFVKERINKEIENDRKEKAFMYYALEKSNNHIITDTLKNETTKVLDLHTIGKDWIGVRIGHISKINENEGFFDYNIFGFVMIIKNVKELTSEKGVEAESDKAIYKIIGPNEEIIADNIQGYQKATEITWNETEKYKKQVEEEFNKINK